MAFGFDISRRLNFPFPKFSLSYDAVSPTRMISETPARTPDLYPEVTPTWGHDPRRLFAAPTVENLTNARKVTPESVDFLPGMKAPPKASWRDSWNAAEDGEMSRADRLFKIGSILRDQTGLPAPTVEIDTPPTPNLMTRGSAQGSGDVLRRVRARYGL